jgi:hypothetical protein
LQHEGVGAIYTWPDNAVLITATLPVRAVISSIDIKKQAYNTDKVQILKELGEKTRR